MKRRLFSSMALMLVILTVTVLPTSLGFGEETQAKSESTILDELFKLFDRANATLREVFAKLEARGVTIPEEVLKVYDKGLEAAKEAVRLRSEGRYTEAKDKIIQAMQHLRNATLCVADDLEEVETPKEREARKAIGLRAAIERIRLKVERLREIAENAAAQGINASRIIERLENLTDLLSRVEERIEAGDIGEAAKDREMSQRMFGKAMAALKPVIEAHKTRRAEKFLNMLEERVSKTSDRINKIISRLPIPKLARSKIAKKLGLEVESIKSKIQETQNLLREGKVMDAIAKLSELRGDVAKLMAETMKQPSMKPKVGEILEGIDRREMMLEVLEEKVKMLEERGLNVTGLLTEIREARDLIQEVIEKLEKGESAIAENLLTQIDELIKEAESLAEQLETQIESP